MTSLGDTQLYEEADTDLTDALETGEIAFFNTNSAITYASFVSDSLLSSTFTALHTVIVSDTPLLASAEHVSYPFAGTLYLPELPAQNFYDSFDIPHSWDAIQIG